MSVVRLIVATRSSGPPASGNIIKEMPVSVVSGTPYTIIYQNVVKLVHVVAFFGSLQGDIQQRKIQ